MRVSVPLDLASVVEGCTAPLTLRQRGNERGVDYTVLTVAETGFRWWCSPPALLALRVYAAMDVSFFWRMRASSTASAALGPKQHDTSDQTNLKKKECRNLRELTQRRVLRRDCGEQTLSAEAVQSRATLTTPGSALGQGYREAVASNYAGKGWRPSPRHRPP